MPWLAMMYIGALSLNAIRRSPDRRATLRAGIFTRTAALRPSDYEPFSRESGQSFHLSKNALARVRDPGFK